MASRLLLLIFLHLHPLPLIHTQNLPLTLKLHLAAITNAATHAGVLQMKYNQGLAALSAA